MALLCGFVIALGNRVSAGLPPGFVLISAALLPQTFLNVPFTTALLTHGTGFLFLLFSFHRYMLFIIAMSYMFSGIFTRLSYFFRRRPPEPKPAYNEAPEPR